MQIWQLWHGLNEQDGDYFELELVEVPGWAVMLSQAVERIDALTGHIWCGSGAPNWLWRIPVGRPVYDESTAEDEEPWLLNSFAEVMSRNFNRCLTIEEHRARSLYRFPIGADVARRLRDSEWWTFGDDKEESQ